MTKDQKQILHLTCRQASVTRRFCSSLYIIFLSFFSCYSFALTPNLDLRHSYLNSITTKQCLNTERFFSHSLSRKIKARSRSDLLNGNDALNGEPIWRSYTHSYFSQAVIFDRMKMFSALYAQNPMRKSGLMIIGDSLSATRHFVRCLYEHSSKEIKTWSVLVDTWKKRSSFSVFQRESFAAQHGATTWELFKSIKFKTKQGYGHARRFIQPISHSPVSPILQELYHNSARYASLLIGTNDLLYHRGIERFSWRYIQIVETLKDHGVIPLVQTLPPQTSQDPSLNQTIKTFNRLIEVIAHVEQVPLLDLFTPLSQLNHKGLRADGVHLNAYSGGCKFSKKGLRFGQNLRNKLVFEGLLNLHQSQGFSVEITEATKRSKILLSKIDQDDQALSNDSDCVKQIHKVSQKQRRWKLIRRGYKEIQSNYQGVPIEGYGTWLTRVEPFEVSDKRNNLLITLLSPGAKQDRSREQAWLKLANGSCIELKNIATKLDLPKGKHKFIHVLRKEPMIVSAQDSKLAHVVQGKAIFAW